jgi:hypothetical protein
MAEKISYGRSFKEGGDVARSSRSIGLLLLGIYLVLAGLSSLIGLHFQGLGLIQGLLALASGILILIGR